ncbi:MAG TPA: hypothetical protein VLK58_06765, partial [Conexibacter sp.]|nr:hypothetical protein [Conexibacter sp.]
MTMRRMWAAALALACALTALTAGTAVADGGLTRDKWWQQLTGEKTINARFYGLTLDEVRDDLDQIAADGYKILNLDWPVKAGPTSIYNGLSASDYYSVEPSIGTDQDWLDFLAAAHARGIAVTTWFNIAYFWTGSALFKQAEADVRRYGPIRA